MNYLWIFLIVVYVVSVTASAFYMRRCIKQLDGFAIGLAGFLFFPVMNTVMACVAAYRERHQ